MLQKIQDRGINYIHFIFPFLPKYHIISNKSFSTISSLCQSINYQWTPKAPFVISVTKWKSGVIWFSRTLKTHLCLLILFPSQTLLFNTFQSLHYQTSGFPLLRQKALVSILASFFFLTNYFDYYNISNRMLSSPRNSVIYYSEEMTGSLLVSGIKWDHHSGKNAQENDARMKSQVI